MEIGKVIYELRKGKGITQEKLAEMVGVSVPAVSKWETGSTLPDITLLSPIARALGTNVDYLLSYELELSETDAEKILNEIKKECDTVGFRSGMKKAFEILKKYPNSDYLKLKVANAPLSFIYNVPNDYTEEEYQELIDKSNKLFEGLVFSKDIHVSLAAKVALASRYIVESKFDEAEKLIDQLPKTDYNGERLLTTLCLLKGEEEKSLQLSQKALLQDLQNMRMDIMSMYNVMLKQEKYDKAIIYAENYRTLSTMYGRHFPSGADLMVDIYIRMKDLDKALKWFQIYVEDIIVMNMDYSLTPYFEDVASDIVSTTSGLEAKVKLGLYKAILLNSNYDIIKDKKEYREGIKKLKAHISKVN